MPLCGKSSFLTFSSVWLKFSKTVVRNIMSLTRVLNALQKQFFSLTCTFHLYSLLSKAKYKSDVTDTECLVHSLHPAGIIIMLNSLKSVLCTVGMLHIGSWNGCLVLFVFLTINFESTVYTIVSVTFIVWKMMADNDRLFANIVSLKPPYLSFTACQSSTGSKLA